MDQTIKNRIEQIDNGEMPKGYKKTEVGIVPREWETVRISDVFAFKNGLNKEKEAFGHGIPIINYMDVNKKRGLHASDILGRVNLSANEIENYQAKKGDVFFTRTSETINEIGLSSVLLDDIPNAVFSGFILRARPYNNKINILYNQYCYSSDLMRHEIIKKSSYTTRALTSGPFLGQVKVNLPLPQEQQRIAEILMKWDEAVELQETFIETLFQQKKNLLFKSFIPQKHWQRYSFRDAIRVLNGYSFLSDTYDNDGLYCVITIANVNNNQFIVTDKAARLHKIPIDIQKHQILKNNDILMSLTGNVGRVCRVNIDNGLLNQRVAKICVNSSFDEEFIYQLMQTYHFIEKMKAYAQGAAQDNLAINDIYKYSFSAPLISEQKNVASRLVLMDKNINFQTKKLEALKKQRKALRQLLLTGIVRV